MGQHDDFYLATREEAKEQIKVATEFIAMIEEYCINKLDIIDQVDSIIRRKFMNRADVYGNYASVLFLFIGTKIRVTIGSE